MNILDNHPKKKKKKTRDGWILDEESDHPIHEDYVKQGKRKQS